MSDQALEKDYAVSASCSSFQPDCLRLP